MVNRQSWTMCGSNSYIKVLSQFGREMEWTPKCWLSWQHILKVPYVVDDTLSDIFSYIDFLYQNMNIFCELLQDALIAYHLFNRLEHPKHIWNILRYCDTFSEIFLHLLADLQTKYIFWCILTHSKKSWNILTYSDLFWKMLTFSVILSNLNMPAEKNRVCSDFWWTFKTFFPKLYNYCSNQSIFNAKAPITC